MTLRRLFTLLLCLSSALTVFGQWTPKARDKVTKFEYNGDTYHLSLRYSYHDDLPQQEITSELHRNNIGKILFSDEKIEFKNEDPSKLKTRLNISDNIYGRLYMICSVANDTLAEKGYTRKQGFIAEGPPYKAATRGETSARSAGAFYKLYINGELSSWNIQSISGFTEEALHYTTRQLWLAPKTEDEKVSKYWLEIVEKLPVGEHHVKVEFYSGTEGGMKSYRPLAAGEFTLVKGANDSASAGMKFADLDEARKDPELAKQVLGIVKQKAKDMGWAMTFRKVKFNTDWVSSYQSERGGVVRIREIRFYAYGTYQDGRCIVEEHTVAQGYEGINPSGPIFYRRVIPSTKQRVDCD